MVWWGTYDLGKPRTRILLKGLTENGVEITQCHQHIWSGIEDKSQVRGLGRRIYIATKWLLSYPGLILRYMRLPKHDVVFVGYLGTLDVLILWPFARLRGTPIYWDAFISLYEIVVVDRKLVGSSSVLAKTIYAWEALACKAADRILVENSEQASYLSSLYRLSQGKVDWAFIGVETEVFPPRGTEDDGRKEDEETLVVYFGQFIPLHGVQVILDAVRLTRKEPIRWVLIGKGQDQGLVEQAAQEQHNQLTWIPWIPYRELIGWIHKSDICIGIVGDTEKAARVIPNKIFQILACGLPLITRDSPAVRDLLDPSREGVALISAGSEEELAGAVRSLADSARAWRGMALHRDLIPRIEPQGIGRSVLDQISAWLAETEKAP
jgi:glycosyltransferase involved in cell wall biosynthesis